MGSQQAQAAHDIQVLLEIVARFYLSDQLLERERLAYREILLNAVCGRVSEEETSNG